MESQLPEYFVLDEHYARYRPVGDSTLSATVEAIDRTIEFCRLTGVNGLLIDITAVTGFPPPSTTERFHFITKWSATARGQVVISMLAPPEMIDQDKIGITMASNRGLTSEVFPTEPEAIAWLLRQLGK